MCDFGDKLSALKEMQKELQSYYSKLITELSNVDKEIVDIEHYIEFYNFNASQGYNAYKMLQQRFIKRRELKNNIERCNLIWQNKVSSFTNNIDTKFEKIENKKYTARILKELFVN